MRRLCRQYQIHQASTRDGCSLWACLAEVLHRDGVPGAGYNEPAPSRVLHLFPGPGWGLVQLTFVPT
jgi:hypothetical protein